MVTVWKKLRIPQLVHLLSRLLFPFKFGFWSFVGLMYLTQTNWHLHFPAHDIPHHHGPILAHVWTLSHHTVIEAFSIFSYSYFQPHVEHRLQGHGGHGRSVRSGASSSWCETGSSAGGLGLWLRTHLEGETVLGGFESARWHFSNTCRMI